MKGKYFACMAAIACLSLAGCAKKESKTNPPEDTAQCIEVYSTNDIVNIFGISSEKSYALKNLHFYNEEGNMITGDQLEWTSTNSDVAHIANGKIMYDGIGRTSFTGQYYTDIYQVNVSVNSREDLRYYYEYVNMISAQNKFVLRSGSYSNVSYDIENNAVTLDGSAGTIVRIDYPIDEGFGYNYTIETDFDFISAIEDSRYAGVMFRTSPTKSNVWYQMDVRKNIQSDNNGQSGIECTENTEKYGYLYPQRTFADNPLPTDRSVKLKVVVDNMRAQFYIDDELMIDTVLNNITSGNIGFQVASGKVRFSNIKITMGTSNVIHTGVGGENAFSSKVSANPAFPVLSPNYAQTAQLAQAINHPDIPSYSIKAVFENNQLIAKTFNNETLVALYPLLAGYKGQLMPNILVEDVSTAKKVAELTAATGCDDVTILSKSTDVLNEVYHYNPNVRLAYISSATAIETYQKASEECFKAGQANASIVVLDTKMITRDAIFWITARGYGAWAINFDSRDVLAPYKATISGANVFIATSEEEALKAMDSNVFKKDGYFRKPIVTGHRGDGANLYFPENSKEAVVWADRQGAIAVEIDIHMTKDGEILVNHNPDTAATSTCSLDIADSTLEEIKQCNLKQNGMTTQYKFPTLNEMFEALDKDSDLIFVIEIKATHYAIAKKLLEIVKEYNMLDRVIVIDFSLPSLNYIKTHEPGIHVGYLYPPAVKSASDYAFANRVYFNKGIGFSPNMGSVNEQGIQLSTARGTNYWVWTFNPDSSTYMNYMEASNVGFTTNRVDLTADWKIRLDANQSKYEVNVGQTVEMVVQSETYKEETNNETGYTVKVISGADVINITGNKISGAKSGTAYVVLEYTATFNNGGVANTHSIYSNIIQIDVK